jgi:catechol 1,2-dioxygenase
LIFKEGFKVLISQVLRSERSAIEEDVQFGVTRALVGNFVRCEEPHPREHDITPPWYSLDHVYVMELGQAVLPRPPIR